MLAMTESLIAHYSGVIPAGSVMRCVARCQEHLLRAGVRDGLVAAVEASARRRLDGAVPAHAVA
jgi:hypothetical protein